MSASLTARDSAGDEDRLGAEVPVKHWKKRIAAVFPAGLIVLACNATDIEAESEVCLCT